MVHISKNKLIHSIILLFSFLCWPSLYSAPHVLVSVPPHKFFVEKIAGETVTVDVMVPAGASAHTYEPTPKQIIIASRADAWFCIGEPFEHRAIQALKSHHPSIEIVDLRQGVDLIGPECTQFGQRCSCHANGMDLHFWLSTRQAQIQVKTIAQILMKLYPEHRSLYQENLRLFHEELLKLDQEITQILNPLQNRHIFVSHPAYAYFCRDYHLVQHSVEIEGKEPTPQQLTKILDRARQLNIRTIFIQIQYSSKGAKLLAEHIGAKIITLNPYSEHYFDSMLNIAHAFAEG